LRQYINYAVSGSQEGETEYNAHSFRKAKNISVKRRTTMVLHSKWRGMLLSLFVIAAAFAWQGAAAQGVFHDLSGVVKKVDKSAKTVVVKAADGTEHTIKYTEKTTVEGTKDAGKEAAKGSAETYLAGKEGAKITVHYTEEGAEKTAVAVKDAVD